MREQLAWQPVEVANDERELFIHEHTSVNVIDRYELALEELFQVSRPDVPPMDPTYQQQSADFIAETLGDAPQEDHGSWFYYSWLNTLVHLPAQATYATLRTARNRNLITKEEQSKLSNSVIGIAGLSVGSNVLAGLIHTGPFKTIRIADGDEIAPTNLNRIATGVHSVGVLKTVVAARTIYELDPYAHVEVYPEGLTDKNLHEFMNGLDVLVEEMDNLAMKTKARLAAKANRIPVVMVTDNGDNCLVDVERFDERENLEPFHGFLTKDEIERIMSGNLSKPEFVRLSMRIIDPNHAPLRLLQSLPQIGRGIAGVPQLGSSSMISGGIGAYVVRLVLCGLPVKSGKHLVNVESALLPDYEELEKRRQGILTQMADRS